MVKTMKLNTNWLLLINDGRSSRVKFVRRSLGNRGKTYLIVVRSDDGRILHMLKSKLPLMPW